MTAKRSLACSIVLSMLSHVPAQGAVTPVQRGEQFARLVCGVCHVVADDQPGPPELNQTTPSFRDIANRPATTPSSLLHFLATTHWDEKTVPVTMPHLKLTHEQKVAVVRYIMSLRRPLAGAVTDPQPEKQK